MSIMNNLLILLSKKGVKSSQLCTAIGISNSTFSTWKTRMTDPPAKYILPICEFLDISYFELLNDTESKAPETESVTIHNQSPTITNSTNIEFNGIKHATASDDVESDLQETTKVLMKEIAKVFDKLQPREQVRLMNLIYDYEEKCNHERKQDNE